MSSISRHFLVFNKEGFQNCMDKLTKRYKVEFSVKWGETQDEVFILGGDHFPVTRYHVDVEFSFEEFKVQGYTYLGCIKDETMMGFITIHGNVLTDGMDLSEFINSFDGIPCHNCNRKHSRKIGHLFQVDETGELIVFGSACAKNYFGINFTRLLNFFERIDAGVDTWDEDSIRVFQSNFRDFETVAKLGYFFCNKYGYTSVSKAKEDMDVVATADDVKESIDLKYENLTVEDKGIIENLDIDFSVIGTNDYVDHKDNLTDFEHNILTIQEKIKHNACSKSDIGLICYLVFKTFFYQALEKKVDYVLPEWEKGHKLQNVRVQLTRTHTFEGYYGVTNIYTFVTDDNIRLQWFTSVNLTHKFDSVEIGDHFILNAGVKELKDDNYGKSVVITQTRLKEDK